MASNPEPKSRHDDILVELVSGLYCPSCGCDLYNTAGCRMCPVMRKAWGALVEVGRKEPRKWAAYAEPDEINKRNIALGKPTPDETTEIRRLELLAGHLERAYEHACRVIAQNYNPNATWHNPDVVRATIWADTEAA